MESDQNQEHKQDMDIDEEEKKDPEAMEIEPENPVDPSTEQAPLSTAPEAPVQEEEKKEDLADSAMTDKTEIVEESKQKTVDITDLDPLDQSINWVEVLEERFGYTFDESLTLKDKKSGEKFKFIDQKHYEALGDVILHYIQYQMKKKYNLVEVFLPLETEGPKVLNIFHSPNWFEHPKKALILIQGAGAVRAGQWARSVCINDTLNNGTVFPFLEHPQAQEYSVLIFNPNFNYNKITKEPIKFNENFSSHAKYMWKHFVRPAQAEDLYIVAHSCGGVSTLSLLKAVWEEFKERVKAIAFTDSVHGGVHGLNKEQREFLYAKSVDWVGSQRPLDTVISRHGANGCVNLSSGHHKHEYTTGSAFPSILPFFASMAEGRNPYLNE